ncbi:pyruvate formate lyase-activating protein [Eubacteriales bacterium OttesenSCG-928-M02]|nr:pyruvate formate lyase-activating protein [Eubacteriales bacterium OttesenSCG-928-M02]
MQGFIHSIQTMGTVDGPGIRYVVFSQGCQLRCAYCHNPDTWQLDTGQCRKAGDIAADAARYQSYFGETGGITVSGGEPLLQAPFVTDIFSHCHNLGVHTCLDTSGGVDNPHIPALLDVTDHCLLDIKFTDEPAYFHYTGGHLANSLAFLQQLSARNIPTWIRQVIVQGINDTKQNILSLQELVAPYSCVTRIQLLPFHTLCLEKYQDMGIPFPFMQYAPTPPSVISTLEQFLLPRYRGEDTR